jgi:hypothetical protein
MGADLVVSCLAIRVDRKPDWEAAHAWLKQNEDKAIDAWLLHEEELTDRDPPARSEIVELLHEAINEVANGLDGGSRQISWVRFGDYRIYMTGGMTWGDDPTDEFGPWETFKCVPGLSEAAGFEWPEGTLDAAEVE